MRENRDLLDKVAQLNLLHTKLGRQLLAKEEELDDLKAGFEKAASEKGKQIARLTEELNRVSERAGDMQKKIAGFEQNAGRDEREHESVMRSKQEQWDEQKRTLDGVMFQIQARNE